MNNYSPTPSPRRSPIPTRNLSPTLPNSSFPTSPPFSFKSFPAKKVTNPLSPYELPVLKCFRLLLLFFSFFFLTCLGIEVTLAASNKYVYPYAHIPTFGRCWIRKVITSVYEAHKLLDYPVPWTVVACIIFYMDISALFEGGQFVGTLAGSTKRAPNQSALQLYHPGLGTSEFALHRSRA